MISVGRMVAVALLLLAGLLPAQAGAVRKGLALYRQGEYAAARQEFERARSEGLHDGRLEYNIGNCWWRAGDPARALVHYRRGLAWLPRDGDLRANRDLCRKSLGLDRSSTVPFLRVFVRGCTAFTAGELALGAVLGSALLFLGLSLRALWRRSWTLALIAVGLILVLMAGGQLLWRSGDGPQAALVVAREVKLRSEPRQELEPLATLSAGVEVEVLGREGSWSRVAAAGHKGWVPARSLGSLDWRRSPWPR